MTRLANLLATLVVSVGIAPFGGAARAAVPEEEAPTVVGAASSDFPSAPGWCARRGGCPTPGGEHRPERGGRCHGWTVRGGTPGVRGNADGWPQRRLVGDGERALGAAAHRKRPARADPRRRTAGGGEQRSTARRLSPTRSWRTSIKPHSASPCSRKWASTWPWSTRVRPSGQLPPRLPGRESPRHLLRQGRVALGWTF